ncbi:hypothetical protein [Pseudoalteromonas piscicida]|uniref:Uncharacterized protein n=1 Tax=Pseudoalteromonas piscicida TaxID=43662 RepID=A0A2A5JMQ2_PSEO7|nr:hypothetical protein [Pseudoalteromonas piscicida]PCK30708.1 hypothetical protein CEX98_16305 [Pseudoalteromonas piscicida]
MKFQELKHGQYLKRMIWQQFGGGNKSSREQGLNQYRAELESEAEALLEKCQSVKTVKQLQLYLRERVIAARFEETFYR